MELEIKEKKNENIKIVDLTPDGLPTIEEQFKEIKIKDEEQEKMLKENEIKIYKREMVQRVKCLCLNKMGKSIMINTLSLNKKDREKLQKLMWEYNDLDHNEIVKEFNDEFSEMLEDSSIDYSKLPIYEFK